MAGPRVDALGAQTTLWERKLRAGQQLLLDLPETGLDGALRSFIADLQPGGFVLPVGEPAALRELCRELDSLIDDHRPPVLAAVHQGGAALRFRCIEWPPLRWLGTVDHLDSTEAVGQALGAELRAVGANLLLGPCGDVAQRGRDDLVGDEVFGEGVARVAGHVGRFVRGVQACGVSAAVRHFPGRGALSSEAGERLGDIDKDRRDLDHEEAAPYRAGVSAGVGAMTLGIVQAPAVEEHPAPLSPRVVAWLREGLGHAGLVLSERLDDARLTSAGSLGERVERGACAGLDMVRWGPDLHAQADVFEHLVRVQEEDPRHDDRAVHTLRRLRDWRRCFLLERSQALPLELLGGPAHRHLALGIRARGMP